MGEGQTFVNSLSNLPTHLVNVWSGDLISGGRALLLIKWACDNSFRDPFDRGVARSKYYRAPEREGRTHVEKNGFCP